ncbi:MAG: PD-(D/E)XK nuclease family protein [Deltaproteobacteria bacterium]|nr:PD-(D/E)XK nuclease family protein [Deltaproteobacteria bacterium]
MTDQLYTASRLRVWRDCHRKHRYSYVLRIRTPQTPAMEFGTWIHTALEMWYRAWELGKLDERLPVAFKAIDELEHANDVDRAKLRAVVAAYHVRWGNEPWDVLGVEVQFRYYLGDVEVGGKIDAIIRHRLTGEVFVVEHKTSRMDTSPGSPYWHRLTIDMQVSVHIDGAGVLGHRVAGCIYDVLKRPDHEPLAATPEDKRKMTQGVGCKSCGGRGKDPVVQGRGYTIVNSESDVRHVDCDDCACTGWKLKHGVPQAPRLYADQRDRAETIEEFEERLFETLSSRPDDYLHRGTIVRLEGELPKMRQELLDTIAEMRALEQIGLHAPNPDSCAQGRDMCAFFDACAGHASVDDEHLYPRGDSAHPELASAAV